MLATQRGESNPRGEKRRKQLKEKLLLWELFQRLLKSRQSGAEENFW